MSILNPHMMSFPSGPVRGPFAGGGAGRFSFFSQSFGANPLAITTSRKSYPPFGLSPGVMIPIDAIITVSAGAEYSLDGGAWTSTQGVWGTSKYVQVRGPAYAGYDTPVTHTLTISPSTEPPWAFPILLAPIELDFIVRTRVEGEDDLPYENLVMLVEDVDGEIVDSIGLLITSYDLLTAEQKAFFFTDPSTLKTWATYAEFWAAISVQSWFNVSNVVGSEAKGVALYDKYTQDVILSEAYRYFGDTFSVDSFSGSLSTDYTYTGGPVSVVAASYLRNESNINLDLAENWLNNEATASHTDSSITTTAGGTGVFKQLFIIGRTYTVTVDGTSDAGLSVNTMGISPVSRSEKLVGFGTVTFVADKQYLYLRHAVAGISNITSISVKEEFPALLRSMPIDIAAIANGRFNRISGVVVCDGNSLTIGDGSSAGNSYPSQLQSRLEYSVPGAVYFNLGVSGQRTTAMTADAASQIDPLYDAAKTTNLLIAWEITNDFKYGDLSAADAYSNMVTYCQARQAVGWKVLCLTVLPRSDAGIPVDFEDRRQAVNTLLRNNWATFCDGLVDVAADNRIGDAGNELDTTYYATDKAHLNDIGYKIIADAVSAWVESYAWDYLDDVWATTDPEGNNLYVDDNPTEFLRYKSEPAATELSSDGEKFETWTAGNAVVTPNAHLSPNGFTSADKLNDNSTANIHRIRKSITALANTKYTLSVFAKAAEITCIQLALINTMNSETASVIFDLTNGVIGESLIILSGVVHSSAIEDYGNGWYRCSIVSELSTAPNTRQLTLAPVATGNTATAGQVTYSGAGGGVYLFGFNCCQSDKLHSYIPSTTANVASASTRLQSASSGAVRLNAIGGRLQAVPVKAGQTAWLWASYVDANNSCGVLVEPTQITFRKRVGGVDTDCAILYSHVANTPIKIDWYSDPVAGMGLRYTVWSDGAWSTWSDWQEIATEGGMTDMQIANTFEYGSANGVSVFDGHIQGHALGWKTDPKTYLENLT